MIGAPLIVGLAIAFLVRGLKQRGFCQAHVQLGFAVARVGHLSGTLDITSGTLNLRFRGDYLAACPRCERRQW